MPPGFVEVRGRGSVAWLREDLQEIGPEPLWAPVEPLAGAKGRGGVGTLELRPGLVAVVRPFRRGGALGNLLGERYPGPARVRRELEVLLGLRAQGVPVVTPLAALARRQTLWRLRLVTEQEPDALPLAAFCTADPAARRWAIEAAGVTCRLAFEAGLRHPDLHIDNILCSRHGDRVRAVLVDLDRATLGREPSLLQRDTMLVRMARHLHKHRRSLPASFGAADRMRFLRALGWSRLERRDGWTRLQRKVARAIAARGRG